MKNETVVLLTGGSSGIGQCTARYLAEAGCRVYELSRRDSSQPGIIHLTCDVTREEQVQAAVKTVAEREGRIDIVVNNAGFGISGAVEFTQTADAQRLLDVNFFGMVRVNRAVLPYMREAGRGRIVNLSSVAAVAPIPFQTYYSASKAAVNAYTMALANEVRPSGNVHRLRRTAGGHCHWFHLRTGEVSGRGSGLQRSDWPLCGPDGAR